MKTPNIRLLLHHALTVFSVSFIILAYVMDPRSKHRGHHVLFLIKYRKTGFEVKQVHSIFRRRSKQIQIFIPPYTLEGTYTVSPKVKYRKYSDSILLTTQIIFAVFWLSGISKIRSQCRNRET